MTELGVSTQSKVLMPKEELTDLDELKRELPEDEYNSIVESMKGQFEEVDKPLMTGNMTMVKLYHCPEYSNKVTTDMTDVKFNDPLMGRGRYRREGQKIGEMELAALLARKANKFVDASRAESAKVDNQCFLNRKVLLLISIKHVLLSVSVYSRFLKIWNWHDGNCTSYRNLQCRTNAHAGKHCTIIFLGINKK